MAFRRIEDSDFRNFLLRWLLENGYKSGITFCREVMAKLKALACLMTDGTPPFKIADGNGWNPAPAGSEWVMAFANGMLSMEQLLAGTAALEAHSPEWLNLSVLPYVYNPKTRCPRWLRFLDQVLDGDEQRIRVLQEMFGYCLLRDSRFQKFFILQGDGGNGKSVILDVLKAMLGDENVSPLSLSNLGNNFMLAQLEDKLANIYTDLSDNQIIEEGHLKALSCGESVNADYKFKMPRAMRTTAKLIFSTNDPPAVRDKSEGVWRRLILIPFEVSIPESKQDRKLAEKLKVELPGIFNWAVEGLRRLLDQNGFSTSIKCEQALQQLRRESDPVLAFLEEQVVAYRGESVSAAKVYRRYRKWAKRQGHRVLNESAFGRALQRHYPEVTRRDRCVPVIPVRTQVVQEYVGIGLAA